MLSTNFTLTEISTKLGGKYRKKVMPGCLVIGILGILLSLFVPGCHGYQTCYNTYYRQYYYCEHGCCGDYYDDDYGCCAYTNVGAIAGGVIAGLIFLGIIGIVVYVFCFHKKGKLTLGRGRRTVVPAQTTTVHQPPPPHQPFGPGPQPQQYPVGPQGPPGYGMQPQPQMYPPPPPPPQQYDAAYPPKY